MNLEPFSSPLLSSSIISVSGSDGERTHCWRGMVVLQCEQGRGRQRGPARIRNGNMTGSNVGVDAVCDGAAVGWGECGVCVG